MEKEEMLDLIEKLDFKNYKFYILVDLNNEIANYISKDKIREKIKELENLYKDKYFHLDYVKEILEELLKE